MSVDKPRVLRNVEDVDYAELEGNRPMGEVIRERTVKARRFTRAQLELAYRMRAGEIAILGGCLCCYPLVLADTPSKHEEWCPCEELRRSSDRVAKLYPDRALPPWPPITNPTETDTKGNADGT